MGNVGDGRGNDEYGADHLDGYRRALLQVGKSARAPTL